MDFIQYIQKWDTRFADNDAFRISPADFREFKDDTAAFFGKAAATAQNITLAAAQHLLQNQAPDPQVQPSSFYSLAGDWNAAGTDTTVCVLGLTTTAFATTGWAVDNNGDVQAVNVDVQAGTWQVAGVDAYTKSQTDVLLATKQGAIVKQVYQGWPFNSTILNLTSSSFNQYLRLDAQANSTVNLPTPAITDVGKSIALWQYGRAANLTVLVQAKYTNGVKPLDSGFTPVVPVLPFNYVAELQVLLIDRGTPYNDTVPAYVVVALSLLDTSALATKSYVTAAVQAASAAFVLGTYTIQAGDLPAPAITVPNAQTFGQVGIEDPGTGSLNPLAYGSGYTTSGNVLTILAAASAQVGEVVHYSYLAGSVQAGGVTPAQLATVATTLPLTATRTADYTLALADAGCLVPVASSSAVTVTVPAHTDVAFPVGTTLYVAQDGLAQVVFVGGGGVAISTADGYKTPGQWQDVALHKRDLNTWVLKGGVS